MTVDRLRRAPTQPLVSFLAVAFLSATALARLGWLLIRQDGALELQRQQERLDQSADRGAGALQLALVELQDRVAAGATPYPLPAGAMEVAFSGQEVLVQPDGAILYLPVAPSPVHLDAFDAGERAEFADRIGNEPYASTTRLHARP